MNGQPKPLKKRRGRVALCILLALLLVLGIVLFLLRDWISLAYYALTTSADAVQSDKAENDKKTNELLHQLIPDVTMRDLTDEERAKLASGELSYEDALALIRGETTASAETVLPETTAVPKTTEAPETSEAPAVTTVPQAPAVTTVPKEPVVTATAATTAATTLPQTTEAALDLAATMRRQEEIIAEIYLLRATYLNEIDKLIKDTKQMYSALPKEQRSLANKMKIVEKMIPVGNKLEDDCDAKMEELLKELTGLLEAQKVSTAIVDEIRKTYAEQKNLKLAELYSQYGSHLEN